MIRKKTQNRKKEIAEERRNKALVGMSAFGTLAGSAVASSAADSAELRSTSMFASMFGLSAFSSSTSPRNTRTSSKDALPEGKASQPSWMAEVRQNIVHYSRGCTIVLSLFHFSFYRWRPWKKNQE